MIKKLICTVSIMCLTLLTACGNSSDKSSIMDESQWTQIPDTNHMYAINTNEQVMYRTNSGGNSVAVPLYYRNYVLYYDSDTDTFYYYSYNNTVHTVTRNAITAQPVIDETENAE